MLVSLFSFPTGRAAVQYQHQSGQQWVKVPVGVSIVNYSLVVQRLWSIRGSKQRNEEDQSNQLAFLSGVSTVDIFKRGLKMLDGWLASAKSLAEPESMPPRLFRELPHPR